MLVLRQSVIKGICMSIYKSKYQNKYVLLIVIIIVIMLVCIYASYQVEINHMIVKKMDGEGVEVTSAIDKSTTYIQMLDPIEMQIMIVVVTLLVVMLLIYIDERKNFEKDFGSLTTKLQDYQLKSITQNSKFCEVSLIADIWNERVRALQVKSEEMDNYFSRSVHDMKMPIQLISAYISVYEKERGSDEFSIEIKNALNDLKKQIDEKLVVDKIRAFERPHFARNDFLKHLKLKIKSYEALNVDVNLMSEFTSLELCYDNDMVDKILSNIFENIIKYSINNRCDIIVGSGVVSFANDCVASTSNFQINPQMRSYSQNGNGLGSQIIAMYCQLLGWQVEIKQTNTRFILSLFFIQK